MKSKILSLLFALACFSTLGVLSAEVDTEQTQYLSDTKATIAVQKQPSQENNQKQTVSNIRWSIIIQCQGKPLDKPNNDN